MPRREAPTYDVFLSYGHDDDAVLAPVLQTELQRFAKPWYRTRAIDVFRDSTDLGAQPELWAGIERALGASCWFVLLASPAAANSRWVDDEVAWWLEHRSSDHILVVLTEGEIDEALPPTLRNAGLPEPGWVDLRGLHRDGAPDRSDEKLQDGIASIASTVRGIPKAELAGEDRRQRRRLRRVVAGTITAVLILIVAVVVAANNASVQRRHAAEQQHVAASHQLIPQAEAARNNDPRTALLLGETAEHLHPDADSRASLVGTLASTPYEGTLDGHAGPVRSVAYSPDRHTLAAAGDDGTVELWDLSDPTAPRRGPTLTGHSGTVTAVAFSPDGHTLATASTDRTAVLWDLSDPTAPRRGPTLTGHASTVTAVAFSPDGHTLATASADHTAVLWDLSDPDRTPSRPDADRTRQHRHGRGLLR